MGSITVSGEGDWGVLEGERLTLFRSREQALAYVGLLLRLGLAPELWVAA